MRRDFWILNFLCALINAQSCKRPVAIGTTMVENTLALKSPRKNVSVRVTQFLYALSVRKSLRCAPAQILNGHSLLSWFMTRPRKITQHCRKIIRQRYQRADSESVLSSSDSDDALGPDDAVEIMNDFPEGSIFRSVDEALMWVESAHCHSRAPYHGDSRRNRFRKQAEKKRRLESAAQGMKITSFFGIQNPGVNGLGGRAKFESNCLEQNVAPVNQPVVQLSVEDAIERLRIATRNTPNVQQQRQLLSGTNGWEFMCLLAIRQYFQRLLHNNGKIRVSEEIAKFLFPERNAVHHGRLIRQWADHYLHSGSLPERRQGRFVKIRSLIQDDDVQRILRTYIRSESENVLTSCTLALWVKENLHLKLNLASPVSISEKTAQRWLKILGLKYGKYRPGLYADGHERPDVVRYRHEFLERFEQYEKRMFQYEGDFMEKVILPSMGRAELPIVLVTHDESCFSSHDGRDFVWLDENNHPIRPKGDGRSIMVSAFLCECHGILKLNEEQKRQSPEVPADSTVIIKPGSNAEGYWKNADLVKQLVDKAFPIFKILHPNCQGLFMFDNSQNHHAKPPDALSVNILNLKDGGKNPRPMRNGWYIGNNGERVIQIMYSSEYGLRGMKSLLIERGLWPQQGLTRDQARNVLSSQPDFMEQREWLDETVTSAGFLIDFYPKYHCEFNFIEMFWGAAKSFVRSRCNYDFNHLVQVVPVALNSVSLAKIRRFARKSYRYMDAYRVRGSDGNSLTSKQIEYAVKRYRQHRKIPLRILNELE